MGQTKGLTASRRPGRRCRRAACAARTSRATRSWQSAPAGERGVTPISISSTPGQGRGAVRTIVANFSIVRSRTWSLVRSWMSSSRKAGSRENWAIWTSLSARALADPCRRTESARTSNGGLARSCGRGGRARGRRSSAKGRRQKLGLERGSELDLGGLKARGRQAAEGRTIAIVSAVVGLGLGKAIVSSDRACDGREGEEGWAEGRAGGLSCVGRRVARCRALGSWWYAGGRAVRGRAEVVRGEGVRGEGVCSGRVGGGRRAGRAAGERLGPVGRSRRPSTPAGRLPVGLVRSRLAPTDCIGRRWHVRDDRSQACAGPPSSGWAALNRLVEVDAGSLVRAAGFGADRPSTIVIRALALAEPAALATAPLQRGQRLTHTHNLPPSLHALLYGREVVRRDPGRRHFQSASSRVRGLLDGSGCPFFSRDPCVVSAAVPGRRACPSLATPLPQPPAEGSGRPTSQRPSPHLPVLDPQPPARPPSTPVRRPTALLARPRRLARCLPLRRLLHQQPRPRPATPAAPALHSAASPSSSPSAPPTADTRTRSRQAQAAGPPRSRCGSASGRGPSRRRSRTPRAGRAATWGRGRGYRLSCGRPSRRAALSLAAQGG